MTNGASSKSSRRSRPRCGANCARIIRGLRAWPLAGLGAPAWPLPEGEAFSCPHAPADRAAARYRDPYLLEDRMPFDSSDYELRAKLAIGCRILAMMGHDDAIWGHMSV